MKGAMKIEHFLGSDRNNSAIARILSGHGW
ncbi:hypothetical protein BH20VER1_BH20VER1_18320 [soil metagenome]|jgi:hypothetical protein